MIMQAPRASLNPMFRVGDMFERTLRLHGAAQRTPGRGRPRR